MWTKRDFKMALMEVLETPVAGISWEEKVSLVRQILVEMDQKREYDQSHRGKPWSDDELRLILRLPPTRENMMQLARAFKRSYGSIEQIYRWAATSRKDIQEKRPNDAFIQQIKRIAKEIGWRAY